MKPGEIKRAMVALSVLVTITLLSHWAAGRIFYAVSPSLNHRLFWLTPVKTGQIIEVETYVVFPTPKEYSQMAGVHFAASTKAMKQVKCKGGQMLTVQGGKFFCDSIFIGEAKERSLSGKPLRLFLFNGVVPGGKLFVMGAHKDSYDSRYMGFIDRSTVETTGTPLM